MTENLPHHHRLGDESDDLHRAAALTSAKAGRAQYRSRRSRPSRSWASMRTFASTEKPPPCSHLAITCASCADSSAPQGRAQQSPAHGGLNLAACRRIQTVGRVKGDATSRIGLEHAIHHHAVKVQMGVQQRAKAVDEDHGALAGRCNGAGSVLAQHPLAGVQENEVSA